MKRITLNRLIFFAVIFFFITGCTRDGFTPDEVAIIKGGTEQSLMPLWTINNTTDSLCLRKPSREVDKSNINSPTMVYLKNRMMTTVKDSVEGGVGIAAPQVGIGIRMVIVQRLDKEGEPFEAYFNPHIKNYGDSINSGFEGCLSVPGYKGTVERSQNIDISYLDSAGKKQHESVSGFTAVIFQHEIDHLDGILYFDHVYGGFGALKRTE